MYLLEHDAKSLLSARGIPVPNGVLVRVGAALPPLPPGPWVVKAQAPAGGRGKAGGVRKAKTIDEVRAAIEDIAKLRIGGRAVAECRIEQEVIGAQEAYFGLVLDPVAAAVRVLLAPRGGVDIETIAAESGLLRTSTSDLDRSAIAASALKLASGLPHPFSQAMSAAGHLLAETFCHHECSLLEINPLFVMADGNWIAGDAKMITDDNALPRQRALSDLLEQRARAYPEAHLKLRHGCDYVVVDPEGEIGLLTTGAGLSMMLIDEMREAGLRPYNFLDVRTGGLRGDPTRLIHVLQWIAEGRRIKVLLVNVFAGITDLGEFARLLLAAMEASPGLRVPVVARLVGNAIEEARKVLGEAGIEVVNDLGDALAQVRAHLERNIAA